MSFKDLLDKVVKPLVNSNTNADDLVNAINNLYDLSNGKEKSAVKPAEQKPAADRRKDGVPTRGISSKSTSITPIMDWYGVAECADVLGIAESSIRYLITAGHVDTIEWVPRVVCVHRRQVERWLESKLHYDISEHILDIKDEWASMAAVSRLFDIDGNAVFRAAENGDIASIKVAKRCRLVNITECSKYFDVRRARLV